MHAVHHFLALLPHRSELARPLLPGQERALTPRRLFVLAVLSGHPPEQRTTHTIRAAARGLRPVAQFTLHRLCHRSAVSDVLCQLRTLRLVIRQPTPGVTCLYHPTRKVHDAFAAIRHALADNPRPLLPHQQRAIAAHVHWMQHRATGEILAIPLHPIDHSGTAVAYTEAWIPRLVVWSPHQWRPLLTRPPTSPGPS